MLLSSKGLKALQTFEGCRLRAYRCDAGVLTIGYGHTGDDVTETLVIGPAKADELLKHDVAKFEVGVSSKLGDLPVSQGQFDGMVLLAFNIGLANFARSSVLKLLKAGNIAAAADAFRSWNKVRNPKTKELEPNKGLTARREAERKIFLN